MNTPVVSMESKKDSKFLNYIFYRIKSNKTRIILNGVFGLLSLPAFALALCIFEFIEERGRYYNDGLSDLAGILISVGFVSALGILILTFLGGVSSFDYYYKRSIVDMNYSLPLTRKERFFGDFISGLSPIIIIGVVSGLLAIGILAVGAPVAMSSMDFDPWRIVWGGFLSYLLLLIYIFTFVVFSTGLCGRYFEAAVYPFVLSGLIPGIIALFYALLFIHPSLNYENQLVNTLTATTPLGFFFGSIFNISRGHNNIAIFNPSIIIPVLLIVCGLIFLSYLISKKRITERVGSPFVFKFVYHIYLGAIMFCLTAPFIATSVVADSAMLAGLISATGIPFLVIEVITNRGFKKMGVAAIRYVGMVAGASLIAFILTSFDGFKLYAYVPNENSIDHIKFNGYENISTNEHLIGRLEEGENKNLWYNNSMVSFKDADNIKLIRDFHSNNIYKDTSALGSAAQVEYVLKSGKTVARTIFVRNMEESNFLEPLYHSAEYREKEITTFNAILDNNGSIRLMEWLGDEEIYLSSSEKKEFFNAFKSDYLSQAENDSLGEIIGTAFIESNPKDGERFVYGVLRFDIYSSYENTLKVLQRTNFKTEVDLSDYAATPLILYYEGNTYEDFPAEPEPSYTTTHIERRGSVFGRSEIRSYKTEYQQNTVEIPPGWDTDEDVLSLLKNAASYNQVYSLPRYELRVFWGYESNKTFYVPVKYHELAKKIYEKYQ